MLDPVELDPLPGWDVTDVSPGRCRPWSAADDAGSWYLDFHTSNGIVPLAVGLVDDVVGGSRAASLELGLDGGLEARLAGIHVYMGSSRPGRAVGSPDADPERFVAHWAELEREVDAALRAVEQVDLSALDRAGLLAHWENARAAHRLAWVAHFRGMYPAYALHERYLGVCAAHGIDAVEATVMLAGSQSSVSRTDAALAALATSAREAGLERVLTRGPLTRVLDTAATTPAGAAWCERVEAFLHEFGRRSPGLADLESPSWQESPARMLALVRAALLAGPPRHGVGAELAASTRAEVLARLGPAARREVEETLRWGSLVDAPRWSEDHNTLIDLRAHLPVRRAALALAAASGAGRPADALSLLEPELVQVTAGETTWEELAPTIRRRRRHTAASRRLRPRLPQTAGSGLPGPDDDVVLRQVFGSTGTLRGEGSPSTLTGVGVSTGVAEGVVRVVRHQRDIASVRAGEVLVCEATSPSWTPVFERAAAAVCDVGGLLTHAAIISREFGVPCVCATVDGTRRLRTGDRVRVDGDRGTVEILGGAT